MRIREIPMVKKNKWIIHIILIAPLLFMTYLVEEIIEH